MVSRTEWVRESLMPAVVAHNWPGSTLSKLDVGERKGGNTNDGGFASNTFRVTLSVLHEDSTESMHHVIAKIIPDIEEVRAQHSSDKQFENEINFYKKLIPAYKDVANDSIVCQNLFPRSYFCINESHDLAAIVMEDLKHNGFGLANQPATSFDEAHAKLTLERLAVFHALSYTLKSKEPDFYQQFASYIQESWYLPHRKEERDYMLTSTIERGLKPLRKNPEHDQLVTSLDRVFNGSSFEYEVVLVNSHNTRTDVLCHGDFLRNNVLFKYNDLGDACDFRMIDFANIRIASPCIDISLFLYMSVNEDLLFSNDGLTNLLSHYHTALVSALKDLGGPLDPWDGEITNLEREFGRHVLYAYIICSFFLGIMTDSVAIKIEDMINLTLDQQIVENLEMGGDTTTRRLTNMLLHFKNKGFHLMWQPLSAN